MITEADLLRLADWDRWTIHINGSPVDIEIDEDTASIDPNVSSVETVEAHLKETINDWEGSLGEQYTRGWQTDQYQVDFGTHVSTCQSLRQGIWGIRKEYRGRILTHLPSGWGVIDESPKELAYVLQTADVVEARVVRPLWISAAKELRDPELVAARMP